MIMFPFGKIYGAAVDLRRRLYEKGIFKSADLNAPTISIGNLTTGGTGKTPLVAFVAEKLIEAGEKVCILTRGYGRENPKERVVVSNGEYILTDAKEGGDEPFELAKKLNAKAIIISDANRVEAGMWAREKYGVSAFILDDGFQHLPVKRDLDIVLFDATNPFGNGKTLPAGILRESLDALQRADAAIITRANLADEKSIENTKLQILKNNPNCKIFISENKIQSITSLKNFHKEKDLPLIINHLPFTFTAFCALGNPENFFAQLRSENLKLSSTKSFRDHHSYSQRDILKLEKEAISNGADALLTTAKDAVKLAHLQFNLPCYVVESGLVFDEEPAFLEMIFDSVKNKN